MDQNERINETNFTFCEIEEECFIGKWDRDVVDDFLGERNICVHLMSVLVAV
jgi:hypothetical protein